MNSYATQIARDWNARLHKDRLGFVTRFEVKRAVSFTDMNVQIVCGSQHDEYWIPSEELEELNSNIVEKIEVIAKFEGRLMKFLIKNGHLIDPAGQENTGMSVLIEDGKVAAWLRPNEAAPEGCEIFDASGLLVAPGFIDLHVHLREPGQEHKETIATGCAAAVAGGWTSVCPMPNTNPVNDNAAITRYMIEQAERAGLANVFPIGAITKSIDGTELAEMGEMKAAGAVAVSDDGRPVPNAGIMRRAMQYARDFDLPVIDHCEDKSLSSGGVMHEGRISLLLGLKGMPALAEDIDVVRDIILAKETGSHIHIAHVSTKGAIEAVRRAKAEGINVTCEVTPHHFTLTTEGIVRTGSDSDRVNSTTRIPRWHRRFAARSTSTRSSKVSRTARSTPSRPTTPRITRMRRHLNTIAPLSASSVSKRPSV